MNYKIQGIIYMDQQNTVNTSIFPLTANINKHGHLCIGDLDCVNLCKEYGTPLYIFDEFTIRTRCKEFNSAFTDLYSNSLVAFASKAFLSKAIAQIIQDEGLGIGELHRESIA